MVKTSLGRVAYVLALVGGVLLVLFSLLGFLGFAMMVPFGMPMPRFFAGFDILALIFGIIVIVGSKHASELVWAIVLIIVGYLGGGIGGLLVLIGGIVGLLSKYVK